MKLQAWLSSLAIVAITAATLALILQPQPAADSDGDGMHVDEHAPADAGDFERGPHNGRLLEEGNFAIEIVIYETGVPPEFRLYGFLNGDPVAPADFTATLSLSRLGGQRDDFEFAPEAGYLRGFGVVREPHSFDVEIAAEHAGRAFNWAYASHEGRTEIPARVAAAQGVETEAAGSVTLTERVELTGTVQTDPARISEVRARFPGVVTGVQRSIGATVARGEVLATIETNESLRSVSIEAPIAGLIVDRNIQAGQSTGDEVLFVIADLSQVWITLDVFGSDLDAVAVGQAVSIETLSGIRLDDAIDWVSPLVAHGSQSVNARVTVDNAQRELRPGQFVRAAVVTAEYQVPLAVRRSALQRFRDFDVVFARVGDVYEVRMLELGRSDAEFVEVLGGLDPGEVYVHGNSYLIKADIEKSGASHDH